MISHIFLFETSDEVYYIVHKFLMLKYIFWHDTEGPWLRLEVILPLYQNPFLICGPKSKSIFKIAKVSWVDYPLTNIRLIISGQCYECMIQCHLMNRAYINGYFAMERSPGPFYQESCNHLTRILLCTIYCSWNPSRPEIVPHYCASQCLD